MPFTPVPGRRLLGPAQQALIAAIEAVVTQNGLSSAHATFIEEAEAALFAARGWLIRTGIQFHWSNRGYAAFEDFLAVLTSRKRKQIRKERAAAVEGLRVEALRGADIGPREWDALWHFYQHTGARKWGHPYLTRDFFDRLGATMADACLLFMAYPDGCPIGGALNLVGDDALHGRYWGAIEEVPFLHFELSYYRAIHSTSTTLRHRSRPVPRGNMFGAAMSRPLTAPRISCPIPVSGGRSPISLSARTK